MKTTVILVRHGVTKWNTLHKLQGKSDIPLAKEGIREAELLAKRLSEFPIEKIYTSKLKRAVQTGLIVAQELKLEIEEHEGLNEREYGEYEGKTWEEVGISFTPRKRISFYLKPKKGEHYPKFHKRAVKTFNKIIKKHIGQTILVVCHGGVLNALLRHVNNISNEIDTHYSFPNASVTVFEIVENKINPVVVADAEHLE